MSRRIIVWLKRLAVVATILIAGCGGGGGGGGSSTAQVVGLSVDKTDLSFVAEQGATLPTQTVMGSIQGATAPVYVTVSYTTNGISYANYSTLTATSGQLVVAARDSKRAPGTVTDTIRIYACYDSACTQPLAGSPKVIPVTTTVLAPQPPPTLLLSDYGIAFASVPGQASLQRSLTVTDSSSATTSWTAATDQVWLSATPSGISGGALTLVASPTGLADGFYEARVTVQSSNPALAIQSIRVGLYVSSIVSSDTFAIAPALYSSRYWLPPSNWIVDPIRPYTYTASGSTIAIDHAYSGTRVGSIDVSGASYNSISIGDDGTSLYALNVATTQLDVIDLDTRRVAHSFPILTSTDPMRPTQVSQLRILSVRVHGRPVIIFNTTEISNTLVTPILDAATGQQLGTAGVAFSTDQDVFAASRDGRVLYYSEAGLSGILSIKRVKLNANSLGEIYGIVSGESKGNNVAGLQDMATNTDGSRVYAAWYADGQTRTFEYANGVLTEAAGITLAGTTGASNIESSPLGQVVIGAYTSCREYAPDATIVRDWTNLPSPSVTEGIRGSLRITSDGLRILGNGRMMDIQ
jgi:hypothetical protein